MENLLFFIKFTSKNQLEIKIICNYLWMKWLFLASYELFGIIFLAKKNSTNYLYKWIELFCLPFYDWNYFVWYFSKHGATHNGTWHSLHIYHESFLTGFSLWSRFRLHKTHFLGGFVSFSVAWTPIRSVLLYTVNFLVRSRVYLQIFLVVNLSHNLQLYVV